MSTFNRIIHVKRRVVGLTTILLFFLVIAVTVSAGCMETEKRSGQPAVEEAKPDDSVSPPSRGTGDGSEVGVPKAVDVHSPGVPVSKEEYRKMKDGASSRP